VSRPPIKEPHNRTAADVARHQHLLAQEVDRHAMRCDRHADVVGSECTAEQQPKHQDLHTDESRRSPSWQQQEDQTQVAEDPDCQEDDLHRTVFHWSAAQGSANRRGVQADSLQHQQRDEEAALPPGQPGAEAAPTIGCLATEGDGSAFDVGVFVEEGQRVECRTIQGPKGPQAEKVRAI
jgi:hypothetical protein